MDRRLVYTRGTMATKLVVTAFFASALAAAARGDEATEASCPAGASSPECLAATSKSSAMLQTASSKGKVGLGAATGKRCESYPPEATVAHESEAIEAARAALVGGTEQTTPIRVLHGFALGCVSGTYEMSSSLPDGFKKGVFAEGGIDGKKFLMRFSDTKPAVTMALKLFDLDSSFTWEDAEGEDGNMDMTSHDADLLSFIHGTLGDADCDTLAHWNGMIIGSDIKGFTEAIVGVPVPTSLAQKPKMLSSDGGVQLAQLLAKSAAKHRTNRSKVEPEQTFFPGDTKPLRFLQRLPIKMGSYPANPSAKLFFKGQDLHWEGGDSEMETAIAAHVDAHGTLDIELWGQLQTCDDQVEDSSVPWNAEPKLLGTFKIDRMEDLRTCQAAKFGPFHAPTDHLPLGNLARARKVILPQTMGGRGATVCKSLAECRQNGAGPIKSDHDNHKCLSYDASSRNVGLASCTYEDNQKWYWDNYGRLKTLHDDACLYANPRTKSVWMARECNRRPNQKWHLNRDGTLVTEHDESMCATIDGGNVAMAGCDGGDTQLWSTTANDGATSGGDH